MKLLTRMTAYALMTGAAYSIVAPADPQEAAAWYQSMDASIREASLKKGDEALEELGLRVGKLGEYPDHPDPRYRACLRSAQDALIAIPGHAEFFARKVEFYRARDAHLERARQDEYDSKRYWYICRVLGATPSPEAVAVLGRYLEDFRDPIPDRSLMSDVLFNPENAFLASSALSLIGLRDPPVKPISIFQPYMDSGDRYLLQHQQWFAEVKSGVRAFSFVGRNLEYRFRPDGTFETVALSESRLPTEDLSIKPIGIRPEEKQQPVPRNSNRTPWWIAGGIVVVGVGFLAIRRFFPKPLI